VIIAYEGALVEYLKQRLADEAKVSMTSNTYQKIMFVCRFKQRTRVNESGNRFLIEAFTEITASKFCTTAVNKNCCFRRTLSTAVPDRVSHKIHWAVSIFPYYERTPAISNAVAATTTRF
jgi:hypothetical protein